MATTTAQIEIEREDIVAVQYVSVEKQIEQETQQQR